jgi:putative ABC transport system ATP-binding protein
MRDSVNAYGQTTVMVTHDPRAAAMADRVLSLADGVIVSDQAKSSAADMLTAMKEATPA